MSNLHSKFVLYPDFVCIGAQKCGTTWLYEYLSRRPTIEIPYKECNILTSDDYENKYRKFYESWNGLSLRGDISPFYATQNDTGKKLWKLNPETKIIYIIRDPVDRAFSQYKMATAAGRIDTSTSFREAFESNLQYIRLRGCYARVLNSLSEAGFEKESILVLDFDLIRTAPERLIRKIALFLGVDLPLIPEELVKVHFPSPDQSQPTEKDREYVGHWYQEANRGLISYLDWRRPWMS